MLQRVMLLGAFLLLGALLFPAPACGGGSSITQLDQEPDPTPTVVELRRKPGEGEQCLVCGKLIRYGNVVEMRYKGRRFYVAEALLQELLKDPDRYFSKLQVRSALFDEEAYRQAAPKSSGWLYFGLYVLAGLVSAALCGCLAVKRGMAPIPWFFVGLVGNVAGLLVLLVAGKGDTTTAVAGIPAGLAKVPTTHNPRACAKCGHLNHPSARACAHCSVPLQPTAQSEMARIAAGGGAE